MGGRAAAAVALEEVESDEDERSGALLEQAEPERPVSSSAQTSPSSTAEGVRTAPPSARTTDGKRP